LTYVRTKLRQDRLEELDNCRRTCFGEELQLAILTPLSLLENDPLRLELDDDVCLFFNGELGLKLLMLLVSGTGKSSSTTISMCSSSLAVLTHRRRRVKIAKPVDLLVIFSQLWLPYSHPSLSTSPSRSSHHSGSLQTHCMLLRITSIEFSDNFVVALDGGGNEKSFVFGTGS
jgi:hypothetical protein